MLMTIVDEKKISQRTTMIIANIAKRYHIHYANFISNSANIKHIRVDFLKSFDANLYS